MLSKMAPYLKPGYLVTFRNLYADEKTLFEQIHQQIQIPSDVVAIYLPPSVRYQMMYERDGKSSGTIPDHSPENPPDMGALIATRDGNYDLVINALLAKPPYTPAVDVYEDGQLLAGYVYNTIVECIGDFSSVLETHFPRL